MITACLVQVRGPAGAQGRPDISVAVPERHVIVGARVHAQHAGRQWQRGHRVGEPVLLRKIPRAAAHQVERGGAAHSLAGAAGQVQDRLLPGHDTGAEARVQVARHPGANRPRMAVHNAATRYFGAER